jgi:hypothetical protein
MLVAGASVASPLAPSGSADKFSTKPDQLLNIPVE